MYYKYIPDMYYKNVFDIDFNLLRKRNIKCIVFDLDNTLAPLSLKEPNDELKELIKKVDYLGFKMVILSNATKKRVQPFKEILNIDSAYFARKPNSKKYKKILEMYDLQPNEVACIGDQLITDIKGANRMGMVSVLTDKLAKKDHFLSYFNRFREIFIYRKFKKENVLIRGAYYD